MTSGKDCSNAAAGGQRSGFFSARKSKDSHKNGAWVYFWLLFNMYIKASRITNLTDARYFAAREVAYLGFCLEEKSAHFIEPAQMRAIREWVTGPRIVGEFDCFTAAEVREAAAFFSLDAVQVGCLDLLPALEGLEVLLRVGPVEGPDALSPFLKEQRGHPPAFYTVEMTPQAAWAALNDADLAQAWRAVGERLPLLLEAPLPTDAFSALLSVVQPAGFSISGSAEERPGVKSFDEVDALFEALGY